MVTQTAKAFVRRLGPGLITGAADDDPSGIATYSQAGSVPVFLVWTLAGHHPADDRHSDAVGPHRLGHRRRSGSQHQQRSAHAG